MSTPSYSVSDVDELSALVGPHGATSFWSTPVNPVGVALDLEGVEEPLPRQRSHDEDSLTTLDQMLSLKPVGLGVEVEPLQNPKLALGDLLHGGLHG